MVVGGSHVLGCCVFPWCVPSGGAGAVGSGEADLPDSSAE